MHFPYQFRAAENAVCWSAQLSASSITHNTTENFSFEKVAFLNNVDKRPLLMAYHLEHLETSPFCCRWFCRCAINRLRHAFCRTPNVFYKWHPDSDLFGLQLHRNFAEALCFMSFTHTQSTSESKSALFVFHTCATRPKMTSVSPGTNPSVTLWKNRKSSVCYCFSWITESGTFEALPIFPEYAIDFHEQIW